jgi:oligosaccharide repeat unit polymerase
MTSVFNVAIALVMFALQFMSGARTPLILPLGTLLVVYAMFKRRRLSIMSVAISGICLLLLAMSIQTLRTEEKASESADVNPITEMLYGNEYSDTRDFAWVLAEWDHQFILGKSYVADCLSFLPRAFFATDFREQWGFSLYTNRFVGLDSTNHAGLRLGPLGIPYLNFGIVGVIVAGFLGGYLCTCVDARIKELIDAGNTDIGRMFAWTPVLAFYAVVYARGTMWQTYVLLFLIITARPVITRSAVRLSGPAKASI